MLRKAVPSVGDSLRKEVTTRVQTTSIFSDLDCVYSCNCNIAEHKHAAEAYSGPPFVHSEDFQQI